MTKIIFNRLSIFIFIVPLFCILSCSQNKKSKNIQNDTTAYNSNGLDSLINKKIFFPNHLTVLKDHQFYPSGDFYSSIKNKFKIVSIFDAECGTCIINLNRMDSIFHRHDMGTGVELIFILNVSDSVYFKKLLSPLLKAKSVVLWDAKDHSFERTNNILLPDNNLRTFMINRENRIILIGNPLFQKGMEQKYWDKLKLVNKESSN